MGVIEFISFGSSVLAILLLLFGFLFGFRRVLLAQVALFPIGNVYLTGVATFLTVMGVLSQSGRWRQWVPRWAIVIWVPWLVLAVGQAAVQGSSPRQLFQIGEFFFYGLVLTTLVTALRANPLLLSRFVQMLPLASIPLAVVVLIFSRTGDSRGFAGPNESSFILLTLGVVPGLYQLSISDITRSGKPALLALVLCFAAIHGAESRAAWWIGWTLVAATAAYRLCGRRVLRVLYVAVAAMVVVFFLGVVPLLQGSLDKLFDSDKRSNRERLTMVKASYRLFRERPLLGWGWGSIAEVLPAAPELEEPRPQPHNTYANFGVEFGLAGLTVLLLLYGQIGYRAWRLIGRYSTVWWFASLAFMALVVASFTTNVFFGASRAIAAAVLISCVAASDRSMFSLRSRGREHLAGASTRGTASLRDGSGQGTSRRSRNETNE